MHVQATYRSLAGRLVDGTKAEVVHQGTRAIGITQDGLFPPIDLLVLVNLRVIEPPLDL